MLFRSPVPGSSPRALIRLHPADNVGITIREVSAGETFGFEGGELVTATAVGIGHKLALSDLSPGAEVRKYGVPIGITTCAVRRGEHLHRHNMASLYDRNPAIPATGVQSQ